VNGRLMINTVPEKYLDTSANDITMRTIDYDKIKINSLTETQEKTTIKINEVQKMIENTDKDLIYPGR
jgi:hypothetical protein